MSYGKWNFLLMLIFVSFLTHGKVESFAVPFYKLSESRLRYPRALQREELV